ncbi:MAG TPA: DUF222 domain-containing protein [Actinomycetota bacterium]|nr:DUF222 domain-containing protein [Actinomycetota bacterium]
MSELRSALDCYRAEVLAELPDARVEEDFAELHRVVELAEMERLRRLRELERRQVYARDGHLSVAAWLADKHRVAWGVAKADVKLAGALEEMPLTARAVGQGDLSVSAARVLVRARDADTEAFAGAEEALVEAARIHSMNDLKKIAAYWQQRVEREAGMEGEEKLREQRRLHASVTFLGMVRIDAWLDPETGETVLTALDAVMDAEARSGEDDDRTPAQRRADALREVCNGFLDRADRPQVAGERPHVTVTVDAAALPAGEAVWDAAGRTAGADVVGIPTTELDHTGPVQPRVGRRMACDASIRRVVLAGPSEPLDVGRKTPVVPPGMRRAVVVRDGQCRFPGCDRPHTWCEAHHVVHWADGGPTALPNLILLCRRHHRMVHEPGGFTLGLEDGRPVFRRPDGSMLEDRAPPKPSRRRLPC